LIIFFIFCAIFLLGGFFTYKLYIKKWNKFKHIIYIFFLYYYKYKLLFLFIIKIKRKKINKFIYLFYF
jgi:hypothetical protein